MTTESEVEHPAPAGGPDPARRRAIYLLPNLFTTSALFAGFYAVIAAMNDRFEAAAVAVFIAMVLDSLDGRVARMTNTQSAFGAEYDSLADMVSFGVAPALVMYEWALSGLGKLGWLAAFIYTAGAALRLARFNVQVGTADKRYFQGLASPAAAAIMVGMVWVMEDHGLHGAEVRVTAFLLTVIAGVLMVSNVRYYSFKDLDFRGRVPFPALLIIVAALVLLAYNPPKMLFLAFLGYAISGPIVTILLIRRRRARRSEEPPEGEG